MSDLKNENNNLSLILDCSFQHYAFIVPIPSSMNLLGTQTAAPKSILKQFKIECEKGSVSGLIGSNGSGKTTVFNILGGNLSFSNGNINLQNEIIKSFDESHILREGIGTLIGGDTLPDQLTLIEYCNLYLSIQRIPELYSDGIQDIEKRFEFLVRYLELTSNFFEIKIALMSKGMKQKVSLLAVLTVPREIYLLDEPTVGLDSHSVSIILKLIKIMSEKYNSTFILSSHSLQDLTTTCDKLFFLKDGLISKTVDIKIIKQNVSVFSSKIRLSLIYNPDGWLNTNEEILFELIRNTLREFECFSIIKHDDFSIFFSKEIQDISTLNIKILFSKHHNIDIDSSDKIIYTLNKKIQDIFINNYLIKLSQEKFLSVLPTEYSFLPFQKVLPNNQLFTKIRTFRKII